MTARPDADLAEVLARPTANDRLKERSRSWFWAALAGAVLLHFLMLRLGPVMGSDGPETPVLLDAGPMQAIAILPEIAIPEAPAPPRRPVVPRPALPVAAPVPVPDLESLPTVETLRLDGPSPSEIPAPPVPQRAGTELAGFEHFAPYMVKPELRNRRVVQRALRREYPRGLQAAGIGGRVVMWFWIDEQGEIRRAEIKESSGSDALDDAALRVVDEMQFTPARVRGGPVRVIVALPIHFEVE